MVDLTATQEMASGLDKQGLVYLAALSWTVSLGLFLWLMRVSRLRVDDKDKQYAKLEALTERLAVHMDRATEIVLELQRRTRRSTKDSVPAISSDTQPGFKKLP